jgi:hypothetical protein
MMKRLMNMRLVAAWVVLSVTLSSVTLPGCTVVTVHNNGHWEKIYDHNGKLVSSTCRPGGSECIVGGIEAERSTT